ncbi:hypothetical protein RUND412_007551 [Rhizina undulata]
MHLRSFTKVAAQQPEARSLFWSTTQTKYGEEHEDADVQCRVNPRKETDSDELEMIESEGHGDIPDWARWIWRMMVLYWIAVDQDGAADHTSFVSTSEKEGLNYIIFLLRTQAVRFQLTTLAAHKDLDITMNRETGALNKREVEDKCILELLGEHIELRNREDVCRPRDSRNGSSSRTIGKASARGGELPLGLIGLMLNLVSN